MTISTKDNDAALKRELAALEAESSAASFSLRQIREIPRGARAGRDDRRGQHHLRHRLGRHPATEARNLADLGRLMQDCWPQTPARSS